MGFFKTLSLCVGLLIPTQLYALEDETCKLLGQTAKMIMELRQLNVPMSDTLAALSNIPETEEFNVQEALRSLTVDAYSSPRFSTEEMQLGAVGDFQNTVELKCFET